jgi:hypothetical protein
MMFVVLLLSEDEELFASLDFMTFFGAQNSGKPTILPQLS